MEFESNTESCGQECPLHTSILCAGGPSPAEAEDIGRAWRHDWSHALPGFFLSRFALLGSCWCRRTFPLLAKGAFLATPTGRGGLRRKAGSSLRSEWQDLISGMTDLILEFRWHQEQHQLQKQRTGVSAPHGHLLRRSSWAERRAYVWHSLATGKLHRFFAALRMTSSLRVSSIVRVHPC